MKKIVISALLALSLVSAFALADTYMGEQISPTLDMECPAMSDLDISDGTGYQLFYSYSLKDPDSIVRLGDTMHIYDNTRVLIGGNFYTDKAGTWDMSGEYAFIEFSGYAMVDSGVCDTDQVLTEVLPPPACGNGVIEGSEGCDDGNNVDFDSCSAICEVEFCGDNIVQPPEECDGSATCEADCTLAELPDSATFTLDQYNVSQRFVLQDAKVMTCKLPYSSNNYCMNKNYGRYVFNQVYKKYFGDYVGRVYQELDLTAITTNPSFTGQVQSVILRLPSTGWGEGEDITIARVVGGFDESVITWNTQQCGHDFSGCIGDEHFTITVVNQPSPYYVWELDITDIVNSALSDGENTVSLVYKFADETDSSSSTFREWYSKEHLALYPDRYRGAFELEVMT